MGKPIPSALVDDGAMYVSERKIYPRDVDGRFQRLRALAVFVLLGELGALLSLPDWALGLSPFDHLGSLPGGDANATGLLALVAVAAVAGAFGFTQFRRRDLAT